MNDPFTRFVPTLNNTGYMTIRPCPYAYKFIEFARQKFQKDPQAQVLEIGSAFGVTTIETLKTGIKVICNDLDPEHLKIVMKQSELKYRNNLTLLPGDFTCDIELDENSMDAILISRVLHFLDGDTLIVSLSKMLRWLKPEGRLYVVCETPYLKNWCSFIPEFERRIQDNVRWPGLITEPTQYESSRTKHLPNLVHWFNVDTLRDSLEQQGFDVIEIGYIDRANDFPEDLVYDGRESVGAVAMKATS